MSIKLRVKCLSKFHENPIRHQNISSDNPAEERHGEEGYKREGQYCYYKKGSELVWGRHIRQHKGEGGLKEASERAPYTLTAHFTYLLALVPNGRT